MSLPLGPLPKFTLFSRKPFYTPYTPAYLCSSFFICSFISLKLEFLVRRRLNGAPFPLECLHV